MLLPTITFTAQRQICTDAIVSAANPISPRSLFFYSASFIFKNKVTVFSFSFLGYSSSVQLTVCGGAYGPRHMQVPIIVQARLSCGKMKCRVFWFRCHQNGCFLLLFIYRCNVYWIMLRRFVQAWWLSTHCLYLISATGQSEQRTKTLLVSKCKKKQQKTQNYQFLLCSS